MRVRAIGLICCTLAAALLLGAAHAPAPGAKALRKRVTNSLGMELALVPAGEFAMGASPAEIAAVMRANPDATQDWFVDQFPQHTVRIAQPFYMATCEVTNAQFRRFKPDHDSKRFLGKTLNDDRQPAVLVAWRDAVAFCQWLSEREGKRYTLPTEAEWEYACRAGSSTPYCWGDTIDPKRLNFADRNTTFYWRDADADDGHAASAPVGSYPPNAFGLHDMLGNVWEWCADRYGADYYSTSPAQDPTGPPAGRLCICRGGAWDIFASDCRCAKRGAYMPDDGDFSLGFRVVRRTGK